MFDVFIIATTMVFIFTTVLYSIFWLTHRSMTMDNGKYWGYASFKLFKLQFDAVEWEEDLSFHGSLFSKGDHISSKIHASIISFNKIGMVIYPWDYWRVHLYIRKNYTAKKKVDWKIIATIRKTTLGASMTINDELIKHAAVKAKNAMIISGEVK